LSAGPSPLEQFSIKRLIEVHIGGLDISVTNSSVFMLLAIALITLFMTLGMRQQAMVPGRWQSMVELSYEFIAKMVRDNVGNDGMRYFPFIFTLFMFILFCNLLGMVPFSFTVTSHIIVTFALAIVVFIGVTIIGFVRHGAKFLKLFVPEGVPIFLLPLLVVIELLSYLTRPISLSVRLFANMMAGHTMLKVFGGFVVALGILAGWAPLAFVVALTGLEIGIAILQAYVFAILTCIYLNDAINLHH
jgi:F-type H+-transporting ATPase subunit a